MVRSENSLQLPPPIERVKNLTELDVVCKSVNFGPQANKTRNSAGAHIKEEFIQSRPKV